MYVRVYIQNECFYRFPSSSFLWDPLLVYIYHIRVYNIAICMVLHAYVWVRLQRRYYFVVFFINNALIKMLTNSNAQYINKMH